MENWRTDLKDVLWKSGTENTPFLLILGLDSVTDDVMLDDINTLLNTADFSDIYSTEERANILGKMMDIAHAEVRRLRGGRKHPP